MKKIFLLALFFYTIFLFSQINIVETFYNVSVVGAVENPGVYRVLPSSRLSEVISLANNIALSQTLSQSQTSPQKGITSSKFAASETQLTTSSTRNIIIKRKDENIHIDLEKFYVLGDESENPYLFDGDIIVVPAVTRQISIVGAVNKEGTIELAKNDRISDIIELAMGLREDALLDKAEIIRYKENNIDFETIYIDLNKLISNPNIDDNISLVNGDRIYIRSIPEFQENNSVIISGEVKFPGIYAIEKDRTTLLKILEKAGNPTLKADLHNAFLQRMDMEEIPDPEFKRLKLMTISEMTYLEYEYFKVKIREPKGKFSIDIENLINNKNIEDDIILKNGDFIYFPDNEKTVLVSGHVKNPGLISYTPGMNYLFYIEQSGGLSWNARKGRIRLIKAQSGEWLKPDKKTIIEEGDMIFVPEKTTLNYWTITKETIVVLSQLATIFIVIQSATGN